MAEIISRNTHLFIDKCFTSMQLLDALESSYNWNAEKELHYGKRPNGFRMYYRLRLPQPVGLEHMHEIAPKR